MKKLLLLAVAMLLAVTGSASTLNLSYLDIVKAATGGDNRNVALKNYTPVTISGFSIGLTTATMYRSTNKYITLSTGSDVNIVAPEGGTISKVVLTLAANTITTGANTDNGTAAYDADAKTITWTGNSNSVTITNVDISYLTDMEITYTAELPVSEMPEFTPVPGKYAGPMEVTITAAAGAKIYYNVDSKEDPTVESTLYTGPVTLDPKAFGTHTIKAIAVEEGKDPSSVRSGDYEVVFGYTVHNIRDFLTINSSSFGSGEIMQGTLYTFNCNCTVVYQNGKVLFIEDGTGSLQVNGDVRHTYQPGDVITNFSGNFQSIKYGTPALFANGSSFADPVSHKDYIWAEGTAADVSLANLNNAYVFTNIYVDALPGAENPEYYRIGRFANGQEVTLYAGFTNANAVTEIISLPEKPGYYTVYGFVGQETSGGDGGHDTQLFFMPCKIEASEILTTDVPAFVNPSGTYADQVELAFESVSGTKVYYTTDGTNPSAESTLYTEPVTLTESTTVKAIAIAEGQLPSLIVTAEYQIVVTPTTEAPVFTPAAGTYEDKIEVTIEAADNAPVYYTLDGTEPTVESTLYTEPIEIAASTTVKAIAAAEGKKPSAVVEATYVINQSGISTILSDAVSAGAVLFDLNGRRIDAANAAPGLYIMRSGLTVTKVLVK